MFNNYRLKRLEQKEVRLTARLKVRQNIIDATRDITSADKKAMLKEKEELAVVRYKITALKGDKQ